MARARFVRNPRWREEIGSLPGLEDEVRRAAEAASKAAAAADPPNWTGAYGRSHKVGETTFEDGVPVVAFGNDDVDANLVEFGGGGTPAYRPLTRGAEAAGLEFDPS